MSDIRFSIPVVGGALHQSPLLQDPRSDFRRALAACVPVDRSAVDATLARALVEALRGQAGAALRLLAELPAADLDPVRALRRSSYAFVASTVRWNLFPGATAGDSVELTGRSQDHQAVAQAYSDLGRSPDPALALEQTVLESVVTLPPVARYLLASSAERGEPLTVVLRPLQRFLQEPPAGLDPGVRWQSGLTLADLHHAARLRQEARRVAASLGAPPDDVCRAARDLWEAQHLAAPGSSVEAWNLTLRGGSDDTGGLGVAVEQLEDDREGADPERAAVLADHARELFADAGLAAGQGQALLCQAYLSSLERDWSGAGDLARAAADLFEGAGHASAQRLASAHAALYRIGRNTHDVDLASAQAIGAWGASDGSFSYATGIGLLGMRVARHWVLRLGDAERAVATYAWARALFRALGTALHEAQAVVCSASVTQLLGAGARARRRLEEADELCRRSLASGRPLAPLLEGVRVQIAGRLYALASAEMDPDGLERAAERLEESPAQPPGVPQPVTGDDAAGPEEQFLRELAGLGTLLGSWQRQVARVEAETYRGRQSLERGEPPERADEHFRAAVDMAQGLAHPDGLQLVAVAHGHRRAWDAAADAYETYLSSVLSSVRVAPPPGEDAGSPLVRQLQEQQVRNALVQALHFFLQVRRPVRARQFLDELIARYGEEFWRQESRPWETLSAVGEVHCRTGDPRRALACYDRALEEVEVRRSRLTQDVLRLSFTGSAVHRTHLAAAWACLDLAAGSNATGQWDRSFEYLQAGKGRALQDLLDRPLGAAPGSDEELARRDRLVHEIVALEEQLAGLLQQDGGGTDAARRVAGTRSRLEELDTRLQQVEAALLRDHPTLLTAGPAPRESARSVAAALAEGAVLLEYALLDDELGCWVVDRDGVRDVVRVPVDALRLRGQVFRYAESCGDPLAVDPDEHELLGRRLAGVLLTPVAEHLASARHVVVVPFGYAHRLAFHALPFGRGSLVDACSVTVVPSSALLPRLSRRRAERPRALLVGDPPGAVFRPPLRPDAPEPAAPLPCAGLEARAVGATYPGSTLLPPDGATASAVLAELPAADVVHLATHVRLDEEVPMLSAIVLAHGTQVTLHELMGVRLHAELMVLSACQSGLGRAVGGDEVAGLTRAVLAAGVPRAVVALWVVPDLAALLLMTRFHAGYAAGLEAAAALRRAQVQVRDMAASEARAELLALGVAAEVLDAPGNAGLLENLDLPFAWAPFVAVGLE